ncbi:hypothetical protein BDFB_010004 [Asbolus verrucosus]|uniref:Uncharacterized protein n=1 Tax=Asbolus verrucosus TaxID=1661398 RepID=A0A482VBB3_ASBVE|nr:hypothetical protein BDFB_010004 [Asbolus verrucosus]
MTLNHSKTWPVSTLAVVQLRVDPHGRTYSTLTGQEPDFQAGNLIDSEGANPTLYEDFTLIKCNSNGVLSKQNATPRDRLPEEEGESGVVYPLSKKHLELFTKMSGPSIRTTIRTDTVSTILEQDTELEFEHHEEQGQYGSKCGSRQDENVSELEKFHVLALTRIEENINERECHGLGRRPSIKVDNWDFIYTETKQNRCPIHRCQNDANSNGGAPKELPEIPLDARKTTTLRRHYYLEGGWGWVVVVCSVLVHVLNHGVQLSCSQLVLPGAEKFKVETVHFAGEFLA